MSPWLPKAVVAIEDRRFYQHPGIDPVGIARALISNLQAGRVVQGGSTISQQLAKLAFLTPERTVTRKVKEALYTLWIELRLDKDEILEAYLNRVYLGSGSYGVDAASRRYFDKSAKALDLAEAAMLAGLVQAPSRYAPTRDLALARERAACGLGRDGRGRQHHRRRGRRGQGAPGRPGRAQEPRRQRLLRRLGGRREPSLRRCRAARAERPHDPRPGPAGAPPRRRSPPPSRTSRTRSRPPWSP